MAYFPFFVELSKWKGAVIGGGKVAAEKVMRLVEYGAVFRVTAAEVSGEIEDMCGGRAEILRRPFTPEDLDGADYVIAATGDREVNLSVYRAAKERHLPVNVVDEPQLCDFIFPSVYAKGKLVVGVSTGGAAPGVGQMIRGRMEEIVPDRIDEILDYLAGVRARLKRQVPDEAERRRIMRRLSRYCVETGAVPGPDFDFCDLWGGAGGCE